MDKSGIDPDTLNRPARCNDCTEQFDSGIDACPNCGSENIDSEWNSLLNNYTLHDVGEAYFRGRLDQLGLEVEQWGIDQRHNDEELIFDNKMDLRLWEPLDGQEYAPSEANQFDVGELETTWELKGVADVKTKSSSSWMGKFNLRHLAHYAEHATNYDVPVFLMFTIVNREEEEVGDESMIVPIAHDWAWEALVDHYDRDCDYRLSGEELNETALTCDAVKHTFRAYDGNMVVEISDEYQYSFDWVMENVL
ncbi:hypothetical protein HAPG_00036 [Halorubrum phage GNf2]|nr:hypothetical protein HAPG_00036 [Halorubrum phage GNf2]